MKVLRSSFVAAAAIFAAACGDKVEIVQPTTPVATPSVNSVTVSPSSVTLSVGQSLTFTAIVDVSNGAATTVTWNTTVTGLTVSAAGALSAVPASAAGNAGSVCATSSVDATKKGCAQVVITAAAANVPAQVSIQSVTAGGNLNTPVVPTAVVGQIDVRVNIVPGTQTPTRLDLLLGTDIVASQTFTAAQGASLRFAADAAAETQSAFPQVLFNVNTAALNASSVPLYTNGVKTLSARLTTSGSTATPTATAQTTLTFANPNTFATTVTVGGATAANANNAAGFRYNRGDVVISMIPVSFSGVALASASVNFGTLACDGGGSVTQRTRTLTAPAAGTFAWTGTFANSGASAATNTTGYSFNAGACAAANNTGEQITVVAAQDANGNPFTTTALPITTGGGFRVDNLAPAAPVLAMTIVSRRNTLNWVNDAVPFNRTVAGNGGIVTAAVVDAGVGGGVGVSTDETLIYTATVGGATVTNASTLAESIINTTYTVAATAKDLLGNTSAASVAGTTFGVDRTIPTIAALAAPATATAIAAPGGVAFGAFTYSDPATLPAGPSTPSATPARVDITRRTTATASLKWNAVTPAFNATGGPANFGLAGPFIDPGATNVQAYYVVTAFVEDGAANPSLSVTRTYLFDTTAPTGPFSIPVMTTSAGATNLFSSSLTDNLDISTSQWGNNYAALDAAPGAAGAQILSVPTSFGAFESFTTTASSTNPVALLRSLTGVSGAGVPTFPGGVLVSVSHTVVDRAALTATAGPTAVPSVNLPAMSATDPYGTAALLPSFITGAATGFSVSNVAVTVDASGNGVAPIVNSIAITATVVGTVNTALNPFARVEFYNYHAGTNTYRLIGTATAPTVVDNVANRVFTWSFTWDPPTAGVAVYDHPLIGAQTIVAIGVNATHDGVRSAANALITTVP